MPADNTATITFTSVAAKMESIIDGLHSRMHHQHLENQRSLESLRRHLSTLKTLIEESIPADREQVLVG